MTTSNTLPFGTVVRVTKDENDKYQAVLSNGTDVTEQFENHQLRRAVKETGALKFIETVGGGQWRNCPMSEFSAGMKQPTVADADAHTDIVGFITASPALRPSDYKMSDVKWRFAVRSVLRGKNIMVTGPKGTGKTMLAFKMAEALGRPLFNVPLGSTQDPRSVIIGNTHFIEKADHTGGTFVALSYFAKAIQVPNAIILLDELTRAHPDAWNLLMPVLDLKQRYLRVDEDPNTPTVPVAPGVTFIATANIGAQYTATRVLDAALQDRFSIVEVEPLGYDDEFAFLSDMFGTTVPQVAVAAICKIADQTRKDAAGGTGDISDGISTRTTIEFVELIHDGFSFEEALDVAVYPQYMNEGVEGPRAHVRKIAQRFIPQMAGSKSTPFDVDEVESDDDVPWMTTP